jgi:1-acyl-sn-glycerol-3-phosphate acyltransferase
MAGKKVTGAHRGIHRRNLIYYTLYPYVRAFFFQYYGKVEFNGLENIPRGEPVIFAPNHQNALMDALIVLFAAPQDMVFLARADIFNKPFLAFLLNSLKILPVFRQRDGATELGKNEEIFDICVDMLKKRHYLCIMPEGNHGDVRRLRAFGKGIFRIAFTAQAEHGEKPFVKIIPVGIDFGDYVKHHATLYVNFGSPIEISGYWAEYEENNPRAINAVKAQLIDELRPLMIDIRSEEYYEAVNGLRGIFNDPMREILGIRGRKLSDRFRADKEMIARLEALIAAEAAAPEAAAAEAAPATAAAEAAPATAEAAPTAPEAAPTPPPSVSVPPERTSRMRPLADKVERYMAGVKELNIRDWVVRDRGYGFLRTLWRLLTLVVTFPFFLCGFITSIVPFWLPVRLVRNIKDLQFHSSVKAGLGILFIFPVWYLLLTLLVGILTFSIAWWIWIAFLVSLLPMGKASLYWYFRWKKTCRGSWFAGRLRRRDPAAVELVRLRYEIVEMTRELVR